MSANRLLNFSEWLFYGMNHVHIHSLLSMYDAFPDVRVTVPTRLGVDLCRTLLLVFPVCNVKLFPHCFASLVSAHHSKCTHVCGRMQILFFVCQVPNSADCCKRFCRMCDPANPTANSSGNNMAHHITNTLESAEAPVSKFNQAAKTQDHAMYELSKQSWDALGLFSEYFTDLAACKCSDFAQKILNMNSFVSLSRESLAFGRFWSWLCFLVWSC